RIYTTQKQNAPSIPSSYSITNAQNIRLACQTITVKGIGWFLGGPADTGRGIMTATGADTVTVLKGRHSVKFGGEFRPSWSNNFSTNNGTFTFASATAFIAGTANAFTQTVGSTSTSDLLRSMGLFVQD